MKSRVGMIGVLAALSGALAVAAGAFASHGAAARAADLLRTGSHYQLIHAVAAFVAIGRPRGTAAAWLFVIGGAVFAGTLYAMAFGAPRMLGAITPIGGACLILGWVALAMGAGRR
ncbi:MAG: hypothetical protein JWL91_479 [Sphingomonas bacterium]|jgi:uncharacterized membrane protein YgdD (TMEM256/DUF423 family)|nr:DUF423 domain-containing protein [Sphingomonas bacterium]MDB5688603.1 hypothetical protein [Sphingomonas bacterium]